MKRILLLLSLFGFGKLAVSQQQILLLAETFENGSAAWAIDSPGVGANAGSNRWIINNSFAGNAQYPATPSQDSVSSGSINNAPFSNYLHIHDVNASPAVSNANWNNATAADRFVYTREGFCTLGLSDVRFSFFWIGEGDANAYGEVYYSVDGGPWIQTGPAKLQSQSRWKYEVISVPAFNNAQNVRLGFRWVNGSAGGSSGISLGIDDVFAVGTYDQTNNPIRMRINFVSPNPVCQDGTVFIGLTISQPICDATFQVEMSGPTGVFGGAPYTDGTIFYIFAPDTTAFGSIRVPSNAVGSCYRFRVRKLSPQPILISDTTICINIQDCPEVIFTRTAAVMTDPDTVCISSAIDVKFNSIGVFQLGNIYTAQLSDSNGSFTNPITIGQLPSFSAYPAFPPGNVSGLVPRVPPACGYYIRVISSNPQVVGSSIGPFCITECDVLSNNTVDLQFCINEFDSDSESVAYRINRWDTLADYAAGNQFVVQLLDMNSLAVLNTGGLGVVADTASGSFILTVPPLGQLLALGIQPGAYYMRLNTTNSSQSWDQTGSIIRITIGAPSAIPPSVLSPDTIYCNTGLLEVFVSPYNSNSTYVWTTNLLRNGNPFPWDFNPLIINLSNPVPLDEYYFYVQEVNNGCRGPLSGRFALDVIGRPTVSISGSQDLCPGDTVTFRVPFLPETAYDWWIDPPGLAQIVDEANDEFRVVFDSIGQFSIHNFSLNFCGSDSGQVQVNVAQKFSLEVGPDQSVCAGDSVILVAGTPLQNRALTTRLTDNAQSEGVMFDLLAQEDLVLDSVGVKFLQAGQVQAFIYARNGSYQGFESQQAAWNLIGSFFNFNTAPAGQITNIPIGLNLNMFSGDTIGIYIDINNGLKFAVGATVNQPGMVEFSDGTLDYLVGANVVHPFGAAQPSRFMNGRVYYSTRSGFRYLWNNGSVNDSIVVRPTADETYTVEVRDSAGCRAADALSVQVKSRPLALAGPDTVVCEGESYLIPMQTNGSVFNWYPADKVSNSSIASPVFTGSERTELVVQVSDAAGCIQYDTLLIDLRNCNSYLHVPQAFSPNGDGNNDFFTVFGNNLAVFRIRIFNRWGEMVYSSDQLDELNDLSRGWDGTHRGKEQNAGTFVYYIQATDVYGKSLEEKGNLVLIR